jgi:hypothetical protein
MFMGTLHGGADSAKLGYVARTIAKIANSVTKVNTLDLKLLERDSEPLTEIARSFGFLTEIEIVLWRNLRRLKFHTLEHLSWSVNLELET